MYGEGIFKEALGFYTDAIYLDKTKSQKTDLHSNRAACLLNFMISKGLDLFIETEEIIAPSVSVVITARTAIVVSDYCRYCCC